MMHTAALTALDASVQADIDALTPTERAELHADCE